MRLLLGLKFFLVLAVVIGLSFVALTFAAPPPPPICGDGIVQAPNSQGKNEKCDDGAAGSNRCTPECGEKLLGWIWGDKLGWISLNNENCLHLDTALPPEICGPQSVEYYTQATADDTIVGWGWADTAGWVCFGTICDGTPPRGNLEALLVNDDADNPAVTGWVKITGQGDNGWVSLNCSNHIGCADSDYQVRLTLADFNGESRRTLTGWGWTGNNDASGFGWLQFNPPIQVIPAWLQTRYGDIYARGGLTGQRPPSYNATYRILSNGAITEFTSAQGTDWVSPTFGRIDFPTLKTGYSNTLGRLDIDSLLCQFDGSGVCVNQYGMTVVKMTGALPDQLAGKIYYYPDNATVSSAIDFKNAANFDSAAGTVIVNGDLTIQNDTTYAQSTPLTRFKNLASIAWIVKGDIKIAANVTKLAGNFVAVGNGLACLADDDVAGCGTIYSCVGADCQNSLTVSGLMMARKFKLERTYRDQLIGSEVIIYDGRLLANTPPGLADFAKALPIWRSGALAE